jgi:predicted HTH domain antitoxin
LGLTRRYEHVTGAGEQRFPFSKDLAALLGTQSQAAEKARELIILGLYQENRISGGKAAELLGLIRLGFVSRLTRKGMDYFRLSPDEWAEKVAIVKAWSTKPTYRCLEHRSFDCIGDDRPV